jgi:hypothetical protein
MGAPATPSAPASGSRSRYMPTQLGNKVGYHSKRRDTARNDGRAIRWSRGYLHGPPALPSSTVADQGCDLIERLATLSDLPFLIGNNVLELDSPSCSDMAVWQHAVLEHADEVRA